MSRKSPRSTGMPRKPALITRSENHTGVSYSTLHPTSELHDTADRDSQCQLKCISPPVGRPIPQCTYMCGDSFPCSIVAWLFFRRFDVRLVWKRTCPLRLILVGFSSWLTTTRDSKIYWKQLWTIINHHQVVQASCEYTKNDCTQSSCGYRIAGNFRGGKFCESAKKRLGFIFAI